MVEVELLVHAGAPSKRVDDDQFRAQAEAYLAFQGHRVAVRNPHGRHLAPEHSQRRTTSDAGEAIRPDDPIYGVYIEDTQLAYTALDSQLLTSSLVIQHDLPAASESHSAENQPEDQHTSLPSASQRYASQNEVPAAGSGKTIVQQAASVQGQIDSGEETPVAFAERRSSDVSTRPSYSSYLESPSPDRPRKKVKTTNGAHRRKINASTENYMPLPEDRNNLTAFIGRLKAPQEVAGGGRACSQVSSDENLTTSELPTTYSLSDVTSRSSKARPSVSQRSASDPGPQVGSDGPTALRVESTPNPAAKAIHPASAEATPTVTKPAVTDRPPTASKAVASKPLANRNDKSGTVRAFEQQRTRLESAAVGVATVQPLISALSTTIRPPAAPIGLGEFTTHISARLHQLAENPGMNEQPKPVFSPVSTTRSVRPLERGHWLIRCPSDDAKWTPERQAESWKWWEKYIGDGDAGWGVWCTREADPNQPNSLGVIEVYCWGELVRHIYILLYVGSRSQVRKLGLQWIDASGEVVVQMAGS